MEVLSFFMQMVVFAAVVYAVYEFYHGLQIFVRGLLIDLLFLLSFLVDVVLEILGNTAEFINVLFVRPVVELFRSLARALLPYSKYLH